MQRIIGSTTERSRTWRVARDIDASLAQKAHFQRSISEFMAPEESNNRPSAPLLPKNAAISRAKTSTRLSAFIDRTAVFKAHLSTNN